MKLTIKTKNLTQYWVESHYQSTTIREKYSEKTKKGERKNEKREGGKTGKMPFLTTTRVGEFFILWDHLVQSDINKWGEE